jgi:Holliday junction resolvasome RuvABC DNA-binding subunit
MFGIKRKIKQELNESDSYSQFPYANKIENDALNALISLGIPRPNAEKAIKNVLLTAKENDLIIGRFDKKSA